MWADEWLDKFAARRKTRFYKPRRRQNTWSDSHWGRSQNASSSNATQPLPEPAGGGRRAWQPDVLRSELGHRLLTHMRNMLRLRYYAMLQDVLEVPRGIYGGPPPPVAEPDGSEPQYAPVHLYALSGPALSPAGEDYEPQVVLLDACAAHMNPAVAEILESRAYVLLMHGGRTTAYSQPNDTNVHAIVQAHMNALAIADESSDNEIVCTSEV